MFDYAKWVERQKVEQPWMKAFAWPEFEPSIRLAWWGQHILPVDPFRPDKCALPDPNVVVRELVKLEREHPRIPAWIGHAPIQVAISCGWWQVAQLLIRWFERRSDFWTQGTFEIAPVEPLHFIEWESDRQFREHFCRNRTNPFPEGPWRRATNPSHGDFFLAETAPMQFHPTAVHPWIEQLEHNTMNAANLLNLWKSLEPTVSSSGKELVVAALASSEFWWNSAEQQSFMREEFRNQVCMIAHRQESLGSQTWKTVEYTCYAAYYPIHLYESVVYHTRRTRCGLCPPEQDLPKTTQTLGASDVLKLARELRAKSLRGVFFAVAKLMQLRIRNLWLRPSTGKWFLLGRSSFNGLAK
jgi:hypothetical protein